MKTDDKIESRKKFNNLLKRISQDEKQALDEFYSKYGKMIYSIAISVSKSSYLAEEIVNDVLTKVWLSSKDLKNIDKPIGWLYTVAKNCALDIVKKEKQTCEIFDLPQDDRNIDELVTVDSFHFYISRLNEDEQQIFILHFVQDLSFKQIAKEIERPLSTLTSIYYRAIEKIRPILKNF